MRLGLLPGQQRELHRAFKKARALDGFRRRTRRQFLAAGAVSIGAMFGAFFVGRSQARATTSPVPTSQLGADKLALGHQLATGTDPALWNGAVTFLVVLDAHRSDVVLWTGFARLARMAAERQDADSARLTERMLKSADAADPPAFVAPFLVPLRKQGK